MPTTLFKTTQKLQLAKQKIARKQKCIKQLSAKLNQVSRSRLKWRTKYCELKKQQQKIRVKHHPYCLKMIWLGVVLHIHHNLSLRACSAALYETAQLYGHKIKRISASTIRSWTMRMGHYYLQMRLSAGSYILIADESILIGNQKILVMLAVTQERICRIAPLTMEDVTVIHVQTSTSWKGADIAQLIKDKSKQVGVEFTYAISDKGHNLRKAFAICELPWIEDVTHYIANQTRHIFEQDKDFNGFIARQQLTRAKWALSQYAPFLPPNVRKKARFHQLLVSAEWGQRVLAHWSELPPEVQIELVYVVDCKLLIEILTQLRMIVDSFSKLVKSKGISGFSQASWQQTRLALVANWQQQGWCLCDRVTAFLDSLDAYLERSLLVLCGQDQLLCCSDVLESMFGKYKQGAHKQVISGESVKIAAFGRLIDQGDIVSGMGCISHRVLRAEEAKRPVSLTKLRQKSLAKIAT